MASFFQHIVSSSTNLLHPIFYVPIIPILSCTHASADLPGDNTGFFPKIFPNFLFEDIHGFLSD